MTAWGAMDCIIIIAIDDGDGDGDDHDKNHSEVLQNRQPLVTRPGGIIQERKVVNGPIVVHITYRSRCYAIFAPSVVSEASRCQYLEM